MTVSFVVLCASGSVLFGLLFGRLFAWWGEAKDEEQALADASIRARFDANRYAELLVDEPYVPVQRPGPFDWTAE